MNGNGTNKFNIFDYDNYRLFLRDYYLNQKKCLNGYSYRRLANDFGFDASNFIHLVIQGKRNLSLDAVNRISNSLGWGAQEKKYFKLLVGYNQEVDKSKKREYKAKLEGQKSDRNFLLSPQEYSYFSHWYIPVVREIISLREYVNNLNWIARKISPIITEPEVKLALEILEELKLITKEKDKFKQTEVHLITGDEVTSQVIHDYHKQMLELSLKALDHPAEDREIANLTMSLSKNQFQRLKKLLAQFRDEVQHEVKEMEEEATLIGQMNIQLFKLTNG